MSFLHTAILSVKPEGKGLVTQLEDSFKSQALALRVRNAPGGRLETLLDKGREDWYRLVGLITGWSSIPENKGLPKPWETLPKEVRTDSYLEQLGLDPWAGDLGESRRIVVAYILLETTKRGNLSLALRKVERFGKSICSQVCRYIEDLPKHEQIAILEDLYDLIDEWSEGTGSALYPKLGKLEGRASTRGGKEDLWVGKYMRPRNELLNYLKASL